jgi:hypothetical protein
MHEQPASGDVLITGERGTYLMSIVPILID